MCVSIYSSLLLYTLVTMLILSMKATEGLPIFERERGAEDRGLLAGADFLSVFMSSSLRHESATLQPEEEPSYTRATRSTSLTTSPIAQTENSFVGTTLSAPSSDSNVIVGVSVSSSVGRTLINKDNIEDTTIRETTEIDQNFVASEEHPSIVAEANKSDFGVEETEPITRNSDFSRGFPASVQPLPRSSFHNDFIDKDKVTVIYHDDPSNDQRARSVSYSTVVQAVPSEKRWDGEKHERRERHFDDNRSAYSNNFHTESKTLNSTHKVHTERNWEIPEKPYTPSPVVYGKPEQNYEVDESASVMTNGRIHGIQPSPTLPSKQEVKIGESRKVDDNQKVGYVVEGRNYRKYRVEERTPDGFIVGEYGVVSHDDGSLRGVRYTADGTISPRLIYDALMKFLSL